MQCDIHQMNAFFEEITQIYVSTARSPPIGLIMPFYARFPLDLVVSPRQNPLSMSLTLSLASWQLTGWCGYSQYEASNLEDCVHWLLLRLNVEPG